MTFLLMNGAEALDTSSLFFVDNVLEDAVLTLGFGTDEDPDFPKENLRNPSLDIVSKFDPPGWNSLIFSLPEAREVDYVALAGHNLANAGVAGNVRFVYFEDGQKYGTKTAPIPQGDILIVENNTPLIFRTAPRLVTQITIFFYPNADVMEIGYVMAGKATKMPRGVYVGHTPANYSRDSNIVTD